MIKPTWVAHGKHCATQITGSGKCYSRTIIWTTAEQMSNQEPKSEHNLENNFTTIWTRVDQITITGRNLDNGRIESGQASHESLIRDQALDNCCPKRGLKHINGKLQFDCRFIYLYCIEMLANEADLY